MTGSDKKHVFRLPQGTGWGNPAPPPVFRLTFDGGSNETIGAPVGGVFVVSIKPGEIRSALYSVMSVLVLNVCARRVPGRID